MNDDERLAAFLDQTKHLDGLDEDTYRRLTRALERRSTSAGCDQQGRLKVVMFDAQSYDIRSFDDRNEQRYAFRYVSATLTEETAAAASGYKAVCAFVNDTCDARVIEAIAGHGVEMLALRCSGYNNVDLDACQAHNINVVRVPSYSPHAVAEHTVALMLMLNRRLHLAYLRNRSGLFVLDGLTGFDMRGKTIGIVGTGQIGKCVIDILLGFDCRIFAVDKHVDPQLEAKVHVQYVEPQRMLQESDIISLHVPLFPETHHIIDEEAISKMKQGVMIINTSRGGLVDTRALIAGLKSGQIGSAGLDVYEEEAGVFFRDMSNKVLTDDVLARLLTFNNVVVTSHQAFLTREALANIADTTLANLDEYVQGKRGADLTNAVLAK